ncbi:LysM peptidoglycan-binding domain-containing protein [Simiduia aestuariiviva]|uniref:LysM domain-containing protein n=1 Tax=Simiduia aestuariiviva TaxID=1510459 RepID=A0A839UUW0_9GAMM|nr:LysM peptidoglycan-binding domain-containing protein [Simiduia aestuariiviva]MBB3169806.1 hypothetical protein [Simiduia aestuariiviva]
MKKLFLGLAASLVLCAAAFGEDVQIRSDRPDSYRVTEGDTLWDISGKFLENPWMWPEIWQVNPQIDNPHLIYPGDVISLVYLDGKPRLAIERGKPTTKMSPGVEKLSPKIRYQPVAAAIPAIPLDAINSFLTGSRIVMPDEYNNAAYVLAGEDGRLISGAGDYLYARGEIDPSVPVYGIYRKGKSFKDPETGEFLGYQALDVGAVRVAAIEGDIATMDVTRTTQEILIEDRLLPSADRSVASTFYPKAPEKEINGVIMTVEGGVTQVGRMNVVAINRGQRDALQAGDILAIMKAGKVVRDRVTGKPVKLPDERAGLLMVFRIFEKMSFGIVLDATRPLAINDRVINP